MRDAFNRHLSEVGYPERMFVWLTFGLTIAKSSRSLLPPLLPLVISDFSISDVEAGLALTVLSLFYGLTQFPGGRISDRLTRKTVLVASVLTMILGSTFISLSRGYYSFVAGSALLGAGVGLYGPPDRALITDLYAERRGLAFGLNTSATDIGGLLANAIATVVFGWLA